MKRILITQRLDKLLSRNEWRDSLDSKWSHFVHYLGFIPLIVPNNFQTIHSFLKEFEPQGVILSGGNEVDSPNRRKIVEENILDYSIKKNIPVIGVCHGMQFLNYYLGGGLVNCSGHVNRYINIEGAWAAKQKIKKVNSFHDFGINNSSISKFFNPLAWSKDGIIKAFEHKTLPWLGIMWHPEREDPFKTYDLKLFSNHLNNRNI
jgi:N5-(cytidine 5'-diphosphoramidyl)-L-glutamine hydrolase